MCILWFTAATYMRINAKIYARGKPDPFRLRRAVALQRHRLERRYYRYLERASQTGRGSAEFLCQRAALLERGYWRLFYDSMEHLV